MSRNSDLTLAAYMKCRGNQQLNLYEIELIFQFYLMLTSFNNSEIK